MNHTQNIGRFRANPVEIAILLIISIIFVNSVYNLLYDHKGFYPTALSPMSSNPISEGRGIASVSQSLMTIQIPCEPYLDKDTLANKIRLIGSLCGAELGSGRDPLVKATIVNSLNQFAATVFTDSSTSKYSTDYIPLNQGKNVFHLEFSYLSGKTVSQELQVTKN
jgi:hypothetical protein